jgi:hypothetical protein
MRIEDFSIKELKMISEALEFYLVENDSLNAELIIDIMDKLEYTDAV